MLHTSLANVAPHSTKSVSHYYFVFFFIIYSGFHLKDWGERQGPSFTLVSFTHLKSFCQQHSEHVMKLLEEVV